MEAARMSLNKLKAADKAVSEILSCVQQLLDAAKGAARQGDSFDSLERAVWGIVRQMGFSALDLFVRLQGDGDLGSTLRTAEGSTLRRSEAPAECTIRSIFGRHVFSQYTYSAGTNKAIELRPVNARMSLPQARWSYLLQEYSQLFCVEQAFGLAAQNMATVFGGTFSVDTLEAVNIQMGCDAEGFLAELPTPPAEQEGDVLVLSCDGKGVPLVREDAAKVPAFETANKRPGNRRMASLASVYSVDRFERTPVDIVAALFRDDAPPDEEDPPRPRPQFKHTTAHFAKEYEDGGQVLAVSATHEAFGWAAGEIERRQQLGQPLVLLMDGQPSLWDTAALHAFPNPLVEILDIVHVSSYVWSAAKLLETERAKQLAFTRHRLLRLLEGDVAGVVRGLRAMLTHRKLRGEPRKQLQGVCNYLATHAARMRYDEYLSAGYPIASGVIEGACRHLVKDRMERSGMRWSLEGARCMLNARAAFQSSYWNQLQRTRIQIEQASLHPHRALLRDYIPLQLAA
jgi:hypothetical protein